MWFMKTRLDLTYHVLRRKVSRTDLEKVRYVARMVHRSFLANILTLRESAGFIVRRLGDMYRSGYFNFYQDLALSNAQRVLLGACVISFAQDSISEDEMIAIAEAFDVDKYNAFLISAPEIDNFPDNLPSVEEQPEEVFVRRDLRSYVRDMQNNFRERRRQFLHTYIFRVPDENEALDQTSIGVESATGPEAPPSEKLLSQLSSRLSTEGTGFVDKEWELIINRPNLRMWRKPIPKGAILNGADKTAVGFYEYRVCGSFDDVSALCFLEVQLNLAYRRHWDGSVALLESTPTSAANNGGEIIRWIAKFPFPMAKREYIYARRWWLTRTTEEANSRAFALVISRAVAAAQNGELDDSQPGVVPVKAYESNMFIRSHESIDKPGLDYFLVYSDDPQLTLSTEAASRISSSVIPRLLEKFHAAACTIAAQGLPEGVAPVILPPRHPVAGTTAAASPATPSPTPNTPNSVSPFSVASISPASSPATSFSSRAYRLFFQ